MATNDGGPGAAPPAGLQFDKVELATTESRACKRCKRVMHDEYFESAGNLLCRPCAEELGPGGGKASDFLRALAYGGAAAILGTIIWLVVLKMSNGSEYGFIAIIVGLLVGIAVRKGSLGRGGRRYQALAMALTYFSITSSYVPLIVKDLAEHAQKEAAAAPADQAPKAAESKEKLGPGQLIFFVVMMFALALAAPLLGGFSNILGIVIIGIALYEAWKINRQVPIAGPFRIGDAARAGPVALAPPSP
jgi:hypothetical protein